ncbi:Putative integral membrane protein [Sorangium cellulosum So ce56]|uniref:Integral membrane protein n=2 Tax=Sorangium cellulosum TaxID=56 RepID=A9GRJ5_SORC5|nr:Putative integral membrane protein [Sorangium cellulosum So ce56]
MWTSKTGRTSGRSTRGKGVVQGLAGLLGIGLCLGISSASAGDATQAISPQGISPQAPAQGRSGPPQRTATTTQRAPQQTAIITQRGPQRVATATVANPRRARWMIAGASTLGGFWVASAVRGATLSLAQPEVRIRMVPQCSQGACFVVLRHERTSANPASLLIPLAGPWIHLGTGRPTAASAVGLSLLGAGQAVGLGMLLGGIAMPRQVRVPLQRGQVLQVGAAPLVTPGGFGLSINGSL